MNDDLLHEQLDYYRARATEYDQWFLRQGRYDRGEEHRIQWEAEVAEVESALAAAQPSGEILELACGTGLWTRHLTPRAERLTAIDASPEMIELNKQRVGSPNVEYVVADLFNWQPSRQYDFVFFGFWLSHVPAECFGPFWETVLASLKPAGRVFFVDSLFAQESTACNHAELHRDGYTERKLNDGRVFRIVKVFYDPHELLADLQKRGWSGQVHRTRQFFLHGLLHGNRSSPPSLTGRLSCKDPGLFRSFATEVDDGAHGGLVETAGVAGTAAAV